MNGGAVREVQKRRSDGGLRWVGLSS